jgi:hypothetical protein
MSPSWSLCGRCEAHTRQYIDERELLGMGETGCHTKVRRSFKSVGGGVIHPSADVERGTSNDDKCYRGYEPRRAKDDATDGAAIYECLVLVFCPRSVRLE